MALGKLGARGGFGSGGVLGRAGVSYVGPGDAASGAAGFWGTHAYSKATAGTNAEDVIRASDSTTSAFKTLANGAFDVAGLTAFLNATTGKTSKFYDQTGGGHPASQTTDANRPSAAVNGTGSAFNGTSTFLDCGNAAALNPTTAFTFAAWVMTTTIGTTEWFLARDDNTLGRAFALGCDFGTWTLQINGGAAITFGGAAINTVYHIAVTGSAGAGLTLYVNGGSVATAAWTGPASTTGSTTIGKRTFSGFENFWNGTIDDVIIWPSVLTPTQIAGVYNAGLPFSH
jgi:hypothetical protein